MLLAPSSIGLSPWKFVVVTSPAVKQALTPRSYGQPQVRDCSHLVVFAARKVMDAAQVCRFIVRAAEARHLPAAALDGYRQMMVGTVQSKSPHQLEAWAAPQVYIALGFLLSSAPTLGIYACPMEGIDAAPVRPNAGSGRPGVRCPVRGGRRPPGGRRRRGAVRDGALRPERTGDPRHLSSLAGAAEGESDLGGLGQTDVERRRLRCRRRGNWRTGEPVVGVGTAVGPRDFLVHLKPMFRGVVRCLDAESKLVAADVDQSQPHVSRQIDRSMRSISRAGAGPSPGDRRIETAARHPCKMFATPMTNNPSIVDTNIDSPDWRDRTNIHGPPSQR